MKLDTEVLIIGSGFGASVAALRFAEAGKKVVVLERGGWISRENFEADANLFWQPDKGRYGMNDFRKRGEHIIPWLGAGVGGGSHVYAGTLKRRAFFDDFPSGITVEEMRPYYERGEQMMGAMKYPDYAPYNQLPSYKLFRKAERKLAAKYPDLVEKQGDILLGISYAPEGGTPGETFTNAHGATQRYSDPSEQKILGGEIDVKNTLDKNYLFLAQRLGVEIRPFTEVTKIEPLPDGGYRVHWRNPREDSDQTGSITTKILVSGAGTVGSTQLLMQNKEVHKTLPKLSPRLGKGYHTNGDYVTFMVPKKGLALSWAGVITAVAGGFLKNEKVIAAGVLTYLVGWLRAKKNIAPDKGTTNSDYIRFRHRDGSPQGAYIEGGRYPTPIKAISAIVYSLIGDFEPKDYGQIDRVVNWLGHYVPVFELVERSWPVPILMMGRDDAVGEFKLGASGEVEIDYPFDKNADYIAYLNDLGALFARQVYNYYIPNLVAEKLKLVEIPHNIGGVSMGEDSSTGVVDTYGRVFGYDNFLVLDGSILPNSLGPNPACTILAFAERSMQKVRQQMEQEGVIRA
ncbi:GMC oxidoreductase [Persicitalea sp.]|uniref:GMC oxidoreductase n=1 Tax=Persicitalea sp. TaxID=3100273 RepID=UPI003592F08E